MMGPHRPPSRVLAAAVLIGRLLASEVTLAAPPSGAATTVQVILVGPPEELEALESALHDQGRRLGLRVEITRHPELEPGPPAARGDGVPAGLAVDVTPPGSGRVTFAAPGGATADRVIPRQGSADVFREEILQVVQSSLEALGAVPGRRQPPSSAPAEEAAAPKGSTEPAAPSNLGLQALATGGLRTLAGNLAPNLGGEVDLTLGHGAGSGAVGILAQYNMPTDTNGPSPPAVTVRGSMTALRALARFTPLATDRFSLGLGGGAGVDLLHTEAKSPSPLVRPAPARTDASIPLTALVEGRLRFSGDTQLVLGVGADVDLTPRRYVTRDPAGTTDVLVDGGRFRGFVFAGLAFTVLGGGRSP